MTFFTSLHIHDYASNDDIINIPLCNLTKNLKISEINDDFSKSSHIIGHFSSDELSDYENGKEPPTEPDFQIILSVTSGSSEYKASKIKTENNKFRYIFNINDNDVFSKGDFVKYFCEMNEYNIQELYDGLYNNISPEILLLFCLPVKLLPAISILCQGYLAIKAEQLPAENRDICDAISIMSDNLIEQIKHLKLDNNSLSKVESSDWWCLCLGQNQDDIVKKIRTEWRSSKVSISDIINLLQAIYQPANRLITPELVAKAYLSIYRYYVS